MSIRTKVLLFLAVALSLIAASGAVLYRHISQTQELRLQLALLDKRLSTYSELQTQARRYLGRLLQASRVGMDTRGLLREHEQLLREDRENLQEGLNPEPSQDAPDNPRESQLIDSVIEAQRQWAEGVEVVLRPTMASTSTAASGWWELISTYEQEVSPQFEKVVGLERRKQQQLQELMDQTIRRSQRVAILAPIVAALPLGLLVATLLVPLLRELRELRAGAERFGHGDFSVPLPTERQDELGSLSQALNRMAEKLRATVRDKELMLQAEVEAAERERRQEAETATRDFQRYNAALEQMVRARTLELENANTQLASSLRQLQAMQAQLMFADRLASMGRLAAGVGHEINNPLAFVISNLNYVHKELHRAAGTPPSEEDKQELLTAVAEAKEGAERVRVIVQDLKTLSRPDDVGSGLADIKVVVRAAVKIASHEIRRRARLVEELGDVPPVLGNASRLGQVFLNLLINAAQAIPEGHVEENEIRITARQESPTHVIVELRDTGCGIPQENLERIFDPFFTTKPVGEGTGLGLSLVHSILTALGGSITVQSQVDQGTTFRVSLPAAKALS